MKTWEQQLDYLDEKVIEENHYAFKHCSYYTNDDNDIPYQCDNTETMENRKRNERESRYLISWKIVRRILDEKIGYDIKFVQVVKNKKFGTLGPRRG